MTKNFVKIISLLCIAVLGLAGFPGLAFAYTPNLSVTTQSGSDYLVAVSSAQSYTNFDLYTREQGETLWTVFRNLGPTDSNGYYSITLTIGSFHSSVTRESYVSVAGQSSGTVTTGPGNSWQSGSLTFSNNPLNINSGNTATVSVYGSNGQSLYVSSNSNSSVATASVISTSSLSVYGNSSGNTSFQVCTSNSQCGTLTVTVSGSQYNNLTFNTSQLNLTIGQTSIVNVYGNNGQSLYISSNSNSSVASPTIIGNNSVSVYGNSTGTTSIQICTSGSLGCGSFSVSVGGGSVGNITFSPANPNLSVGQNMTVSIYAPYQYSGSYYLSSNSNSGVVSASVSGTTVNLYGNSSGNASLVICQTSNSSTCGTLTVNVSGSQYGSLTFSSNPLNVNSGSTATVSVYGGNGQTLYVSGNSSVASATVVNTTSLSVYGNSAGTASIQVCTYGYAGCSTLTVNVSSSNYSSLYFITQNLPNANVGTYYQNQVTVSGGDVPYRFTLLSGTLPPGLNLANDGTISGVPTNYSTYYFTLQAWDNVGRQASRSFSLSTSGGGTVLGSTTYQNGTLVMQGPTVYIIYKNTKTPFTSAEAFRGLGFDFADIACRDCGYLSDSGHAVTTANASHPWGSWVINGGTVYFVHESGLIPISSYDVFLNNGGQGNLIVPMNSYDASLPLLSVMVYNDMRLR